MTTQSILMFANIFSAFVLFVYSACQLSMRRWKLSQIEMYAHVLLIGGALSVLFSSVESRLILQEVIINTGFALLVIIRSWRRWRIAVWRGARK